MFAARASMDKRRTVTRSISTTWMRSHPPSATLPATDMNPIRPVLARTPLACALLAGFVGGSAVQAAPQDARPPLERPQILWQRSLDDALAISNEQHRPLFVVINVDGESASDRIVTERYRDPNFVEVTRSFTCVVASISRHNPRDYDERGRRIPCPRLGEVTCAEHIALEPILFDRFLGGARIAPRHALIQPDKTKSFDLFEQWDWTALDQATREAAEDVASKTAATGVAPGLSITDPATLPQTLDKKTKPRLAQWRALAGARSARGRDAFETVVAGTAAEARLVEALDAIAEVGDGGALPVLRGILLCEPVPFAALFDKVGSVAAVLKVGSGVAAVVRERLSSPGAFPGAPGLGADRALLPLLARFEGTLPAAKSHLLARFAIGDEADRRAAGDALAPNLTIEDVSRVAAAVEAEGGATQLAELLVFARDVARFLPRVEKPAAASPSVEELERELDASDSALSANQSDAAAQERFGRASLNVARRYVETGGGNAKLHLEDAEAWLARAARARPNDSQLAFERARAAYLSGHFEAQEQIALEAFRALSAREAIEPRSASVLELVTPGSAAQPGEGDVRRAAALVHDDEALEALRWIGDAAARLIPARAGRDPAVEVGGYVRGSRALAFVAVSPSSDETDWLSLASFLGAIGLDRDALAAWQSGVERWPESNALRDGLTRALWRSQRVDLIPVKADWFAERFPNSGACSWYAGFAWLMQAEDLRRQEKDSEAVGAYVSARARFEASIALEPNYTASAIGYIARCELGAGFALCDLGRLPVAADSLVSAIRCSAGVIDVRDGLDREAVDLVDALLEWREGRKSPLDPLALAEQLASAAPGSPRMVLAVADAELREGLRADGRSPRTQVTTRGALEHVPCEEGDAYMADSIAVARMAVRILENDETRQRLSQSLAVHGERWLAREDAAKAAPLLSEAATWLGETPPDAGADLAQLRGSAAQLRARLGPARPVFRPGR